MSHPKFPLIESLVRGMEVFSCFDDSDSRLTNLELSERTGLPKPTVSRLTYTLMLLRYLSYNEADGRYALSGKLLGLVRPLLTPNGLADVHKQAMRRLSQETGCTVAIGQRLGMSIVYVYVIRGGHLVNLDIGVGYSVPILRSAIGRAYVASLSKPDRDSLLEQLTNDKSESLATVIREMSAATKSLATYSYCTTLGDLFPYINAAAVPVHAKGMLDTTLLMCGGPSNVLTPEVIHKKVGPALVELARQFEAE